MLDDRCRFDCLKESAGTWMVWDNDEGCPATIGGFVLAGLTEQRARMARNVLTRIYRHGLDARSQGRRDPSERDPQTDRP